METSSTQLSRFHVIVFSDDWGRHPSSSQHIFRHLLDKVEVTWVNTVGLRTLQFSLYDLKRALQVLGKWAGSPTQPKSKQNPNVLTPKMLPSFRYRLATIINQKLLLHAVCKSLPSLKKNRRSILVSTLPIIPRLFSSGIFDRTIYYCVDDFTNWPGVDGAAMRQLEEETLQSCDTLIATSEELFRSRGKRCKQSHILLHGVDFNHFSQAVKLSPPSRLQALPKPIIGFWGVFDDRIDAEILIDTAMYFKSGSVVVLGPIDRDTQSFEKLPNIHFFGSIPYKELPSWASGFDVCILPYKVDESTIAINPLKLREYLATRKPVVATALPEVLRLSQFISVASRNDFPESISRAIATPTSSDTELEAFLRNESWEKKAEEFWGIATAGL
jgi:glycosyltransferase involved in cell wall biosynthesis